MKSLTKIYFKSFCENFKYENESSVNIYSTNKTKCCNGNSFAEKSIDVVDQKTVLLSTIQNKHPG